MEIGKDTSNCTETSTRESDSMNYLRYASSEKCVNDRLNILKFMNGNSLVKTQKGDLTEHHPT